MYKGILFGMSGWEWFDHTDLEVDRLENGNFKLVAQYNDYKSKVIWPRENVSQTLQTPLTIPSNSRSSP